MKIKLNMTDEFYPLPRRIRRAAGIGEQRFCEAPQWQWRWPRCRTAGGGLPGKVREYLAPAPRASRAPQGE